MASKSIASGGLSNDTKTIIVVLVLLFAFPLGLVLMWIWTNWPKWVKLLITLPLIIFFLAISAIVVLFARNQFQSRQVQRINENIIQQAPSSSFSSENVDEIMGDINETRSSQGLNALDKDNNLCAYATKRALEYKQKGQAGLLTDFKNEAENPINKKIYFSDYSYVLSRAIGTTETNLQKIADKYTAEAGQVAMSPNITNACVAGIASRDEKMWLTVFVGGRKK